jgi:hypothetical protein
MNFRGIVGGLYMAYSYLDNWDIKRLDDIIEDRSQLFLAIDDLISSYAQHEYERGYSNGYEECYEQCELHKEGY